MVEAKCIVQGLSVGCKKKQTVVLSIFEVSEHDNQPELEHELLPQYVIDTGEHDGTVCFFRNDILQYETATRNMSSAETGSSAEDRGRIDTSRPKSSCMPLQKSLAFHPQIPHAISRFNVFGIFN